MTFGPDGLIYMSCCDSSAIYVEVDNNTYPRLTFLIYHWDLLLTLMTTYTCAFL